MGFNYGREKRRFDKEWEQLQKEYAAAGMEEADIARMKEFDWEWFCNRRTYENHNQTLPDEGDMDDDGRRVLFRKFQELSADFEQKGFSDRYAWLQDIKDKKLYHCLSRLEEKDLELLTLVVMEGHAQVEVAKLWGCSESAISQRMKKIKKFLRDA